MNVYPTHWWVGMKNPSLQLMVHSTKDINKNVIVTDPAITITSVHQPENKHYLFIDIVIKPNAQTGNYTFQFGDKSILQYELKKRETGHSNLHQGVHSSDLVYLIMPDRFSNGNKSNDAFSDLKDSISDRNNPYARHGGDIAGIVSKLDNLKKIGVTTLWMTPMMENDMPRMQEGKYWMSGYHGYWITNHYNVDKRLGSNDEYKNLVKVAHQKGMKIIQDAVYNHVGVYHNTVVDLPMKSWLNQWDSYQGANHREEVFMDPYASNIDKKIMIGGWFVPHLPDLNLANPYCAKFIIQNTIWSTEEFGLDGWRVDTYKYCDEKFLNEINIALEKEYPQLTFFGEAWTNSVPASAYFARNNIKASFNHNLHGVIDFPLNNAILEAVNQPFGWTEGIMKVYMTLSQDFLYQDPNKNCIFLDNHDTNRFFSIIGEDLSKYKMALGLLFTLRGIPQVYYGTEILMKNFKDPNDAAVRKDYPGGWVSDSINKFDSKQLSSNELDAYNFFGKLANYRKTSLPLTIGKTKQFIPQNGIYVYFKTYKDQTLMCVVNTNNDQSELQLDRFIESMKGFSKSMDVLNDNKKEPLAKKFVISAKSFNMYELVK